MLLPVDANDASTLARFARWYVSHKWFLLVWYVLLMVVPLGLTALWNYKHPNIQAQAILDFGRYVDVKYGFQWIRASESSKIDFPGFEPTSKISGLMWRGLTAGVSRNEDLIGTFSLYIYGSDEGVGHYVLLGGIKGNTPSHDYGHIPLASYNAEKARDDVKKRGILDHAVSGVSEQLNQLYRPLELYLDEETEALEIYDAETGRNAGFVFDESLGRESLVFGPPPIAVGPYVKQPGLQITEESHSTSVQQLIFRVQDVYEHPLKHVRVSVDSETGYSYEQVLLNDMSDMTISLPLGLPQVRVTISRGGYRALEADVALSQNIQRVDAVLEPRLRQ